jgi:hypothetical protein
MAQERQFGGARDLPSITDVIKQIKENKQLYSQYDPPEKLQIVNIKFKQKTRNPRYLEDYTIDVASMKLDNQNCDIWNLGIIILEIYLSLYVMKKDCREMVHNLYLNKMSYQSRCTIITQLLDSQKNSVICELLFMMLKDHNQDRPTADQFLSKNRSIHYFSYMSDNKIDGSYLPEDINLLQVFSSNE